MVFLQPVITKTGTGADFYAPAGSGGGGGGVAGVVGGTGISVVTSIPGNVATVTNDGVTQAIGGSGISVSGDGTGAVTITNEGLVAIAAGQGLSTTGNVGSITLTNEGVRTLTAGTNILLTGTPNDITVSATGAANPPFLSSITLGAAIITAGSPGTGAMSVVLGTKMAADFGGGILPVGYTYVVDLGNVEMFGIGNSGVSDVVQILASNGTQNSLVKTVVISSGITNPVLQMGQVILDVPTIKAALTSGPFDRFVFLNAGSVAFASVSVPTSPVPAMCYPGGVQ